MHEGSPIGAVNPVGVPTDAIHYNGCIKGRTGRARMDEPIGPAEPGVVDAFDRRVAACLAAAFQMLPASSRRLLDPFSGRSVFLNAERARRPASGSGAHPYRSGRTPPTLSYVRVGTLDVVVETETLSLELGSLGGVPPYNIAVRCGTSAGHLHAEVIPRSGLPVAAGFEKSTGLYVTTRDPFDVAAALRSWARSAMHAAPWPPAPGD